MGININCKKNNSGVWCKDKRIKRSLFGLGARMCLVAEGKECNYQDIHTRPPSPLSIPPAITPVEIVLKIKE